MNKEQQEVRNQIIFLISQYRRKEINIHELMSLMKMTYDDFIELHPEEHPYYHDRKRIEKEAEQAVKRYGTTNN